MILSSLSDLAKARRIVVKVGSSLLVEKGQARTSWLKMLGHDIKALRDGGADVIIVSSGAIALGAAKLGFSHGGRGSLADAQAAAAVGQIELARLWSENLASFDLMTAQLLLTLEDLEDRRRYLNASATLARLLETGTVPVVNENDSVATEEIRFGDNDRLAARVAQAADADVVLLLSDVDGLYDRDPRENGSEIVLCVDGITAETLAMASAASSSGMGSGGMTSKLQAAQIAERAGITLAIINGKPASPIAHAVKANRGTVFLPQRRDAGRKAWLGGRLAPKGALTVDAGCETALREGASLLAAGIIKFEGDFDRGELVSVVSALGQTLAQGLIEYSAADCRKIIGLREGDQANALGYAPRSAVVHRDHMVLM
jgi:glutamate 5-kinase